MPPMTPTRALTLGALLLLLTPAAATADELTATLGQPLKEVSHEVTARIDDGVGVMVVRRSFFNGGDRHEEASLEIKLPPGATATGLRIKARDRWFDGELLPADEAARLYTELTGLGPHTPRDPALLQWVWADTLHLHLFPIAPNSTSTVEYTLTVATRYHNGQHVLSYPRPTLAANLAEVTLRVRPGGGGGREVRLDGQPVPTGQPVVLDKPETQDDPWALREPNASHVTSAIEVAQDAPIERLAVHLDVRHTFSGDLMLRLIDPQGGVHVLHNQKGGGDNDVRGAFSVDLPKGAASQGTWRLLASDHAALDSGSIDAWSLRMTLQGQEHAFAADDLPVFIPDAPSGDAAGFAALTLAPGAIPVTDARLGRARADEEHDFLRLEVDAAPQLSPTPRALSVVFVLDASRSLDAEPWGVRSQLAVVRSFLRHVPDAHFEVVATRRRADPVLGAFQPASQADALIAAAEQRGAFALGNGSALDDGLELAARLLRGRGGERMVVAFTDDLLRPAWTNQAAWRALHRLPGGVTTHLVRPRPNHDVSLSEARRDDHPLAPVMHHHGGIVLQIDGRLGDPDTPVKPLDAISLGLVRPIRVDHFAVHGWPEGSSWEPPEALYEGDGLREMIQTRDAPHRLVLTGSIWARPFRRVVTTSLPFNRATAALVFSHDMHHDLDEGAMTRLALFGRAVSPVTSYLAIEPGVRPSNAGIEREVVGFGAGGFGASGSAMGGGGLSVRSSRPSIASMLEDAVAACRATHQDDREVEVGVETTWREIVDVVPQGDSSPLRRCVVEATWVLELPSSYNRRRDSFMVTL